LVVDCQSDLLDELGSRVVAPLRDAEDSSVSKSRLNPPVALDDASYRLGTQFLRAVYARQLSDRVGSLRVHEYEIKAAIDMLVSGF
jgi:toxin CcdB